MFKLTATTATLMTPEEKALFRASESRLLPKVGDAELRTQIERARHLRKKYDDLLQRERAVAQREGAEPGSRASKGHPATVRKSTAFTHVVSQFEAESNRRAGTIVPAPRPKKSPEGTQTTGSAKKKPSKRAAPKSMAPSASTKSAPTVVGRGSKANSSVTATTSASRKSGPRSAASSSRGGVQSPTLRAKQSETRQQRGPAQRQVGHAAARGRRQQARSDSRG